MNDMRRQLLRFATSAALLSLCWSAGHAQSYPSRPVTLIVPYGAGGPTDAIARIVAERMRAPLGQPVIIDNVTGASGSLGIGKAARAAPDGYTISIGTWATHVLNGAVFPLNYNLQTAFDPIAQIASDPPMIVSRKDIPAGNLKELIAWLKANPEKATQGTGGPGSVSHILGVLFQKKTDTQFQLVPYRTGVHIAMQDMMAGRIDFMFSVAASGVPMLQAGTIKGYAVTAKRRLSVAPDVPTVDEAGLPDFHMSNWHGIWAPKGTPAAVIQTLKSAIREALADPMLRQRLVALGQEIAPEDSQTPEGLAALHDAEIGKWWPIINEAGIKVQ
jgi:tripartite-type tricarboxylate transporter receptor subunit TctC